MKGNEGRPTRVIAAGWSAGRNRLSSFIRLFVGCNGGGGAIIRASRRRRRVGFIFTWLVRPPARNILKTSPPNALPAIIIQWPKRRKGCSGATAGAGSDRGGQYWRRCGHDGGRFGAQRRRAPQTSLFRTARTILMIAARRAADIKFSTRSTRLL